MATATLVREVQRRTGAPLLECKKAVDASGGELRNAMNLLAEAGFTGGRPRYDPAERGSYGFDAYGRRVVEACVDVLSEYLPRDGAPLTAVVLRSYQGIPVNLVTAYAGPHGRKGEPITEVDLHIQSGAIPERSGVEDRLLRAFLYRNGLQATRPDVPELDEAEPNLQWEFSSLPACLYCYEMFHCSQAVLEELVRSGFNAAPGCAAMYAFEDYFLDASTAECQLADVRKRIAEYLPGASLMQDFAQLCYETAEKQRWFVDLA
ncbi:hypothetical protein [Myxococcus sp. SDU36]|uniref:hypothetical protein n=1 Tax=Myxococcus sp. SDU36 TaxID=2831967 RepID=UPI00254390E3|nr:hypothetical protein [Myxococcus sp. SDU36]WIG95917.1 hypothetical protein KGD87_00085 [Myxococcus sp. SDU36]